LGEFFFDFHLGEKADVNPNDRTLSQVLNIGAQGVLSYLLGQVTLQRVFDLFQGGAPPNRSRFSL
jgi:hypothetical protein